MPKVTSSQSNLTTGEISPKCLGRYDHAKYNNAVKRMENWLINQLGGGFYRPGTQFVIETVNSDKASRVIPFQYSADQDYVIEMGDLYMRFFENDAYIGSSTLVTKFLSHWTGSGGETAYTAETGQTITFVDDAHIAINAPVYGDGSDGAVVISVNTALTANMNYTNLTVNAGITLDTAGFTINCTGTLTNNGTITNTNGSAASAGATGATGYGELHCTGGAGGAGGAGGTNGGAITINAATFTNNSLLQSNGTAGSNGSAGGNATWDGIGGIFTAGYADGGGGGGGGAGGSGGVVTITYGTKTDGTITVSSGAGGSGGGGGAGIFKGSPGPAGAAGAAGTPGSVSWISGGSPLFASYLELDGAGDYCTIPDSADWDIGAGDYTMMALINMDNLPTDGNKMAIFSQYEDATHYWELSILNTAGTYSIQFLFYGGAADRTVTVNSTGFAADTWYYIAMCKSGTTYRFFQDGVLQGTAQTNANTPDAVAAVVTIGAVNGGSYFDGALDETVLEQSYARYTAAYTPPVIAYTVDTITTGSIVTTYLEDDLFDIHYCQSNDVMYITHPDYPPRKLSRTGATTFEIADVDFIRGPFLDTNIDATIEITPSADSGAGITLDTNGTGEIFTADHVGSLWRVKDGVVKIATYVDAEEVTGDVQAEPDGTAGDLNTGPAATSDWAEGAFSAERGYPATCTFHEQRLYYANTAYEPQKFWGSVVGAYDSFDAGTAADDDAVTYEMATEQRNAIQWMSSGKNSLVIGTNGGTFSASTGSVTEPITPTNVLVSRDTNYGVTNLLPQRISSFLYYIQRDLNRLRELKYAFESDSQISSDMTLLAEHILIDGDGAVDIAHQQSPNDRIWVVRDDGQMSILTRNPEQDVMGWSRMVAGSDATGDGEFESVCVIPKQYENDQVWVIVKRVIDGVTRRFVEFFTSEYPVDDWDFIQCDSSLTLDDPKDITGITSASPGVITSVTHGFSDGDIIKINGVNSVLNGVIGSMVDGEYELVYIGPDTFSLQTLAGVAVDTTSLGTYISGGEVRKMVTIISNLDHLAGETVVVQTDGYLPSTETYTVSPTGSITLSERAAVVHAGLPYDGTLQLLKLSDGNPKGTGQTQDRRIYKGTLRLHRTQGLNIGRTLTTLDPLNYNDEDDEEALFTGDMPKVFQTTWSRGDEIIIQQDKPLPAQILSIIMESEVN